MIFVSGLFLLASGVGVFFANQQNVFQDAAQLDNSCRF